MAMITRSYTIKFNTPAFLGDASQSGAWRTPPFKALIRHWWRVAYAAENRSLKGATLINLLRAEEARLFGSAADDTGHSSALRMRIDKWAPGQMKSWQGGGSVAHPQVGQGGRQVDALLYLGYGPLAYNREARATKFKSDDQVAINAGEQGTLRLAFPNEFSKTLNNAIYLINRFGTIGGRSRNGWGAFSLQSSDDRQEQPGLSQFLLGLDESLAQDWPSSLGMDGAGNPLIWQFRSGEASWQKIMTKLADLKIRLRTSEALKLDRGQHPRPEAIHWLAYPVTNHVVGPWGRNMRLPNSLRFKVIPHSDGVTGTIFHCPCSPPEMHAPLPTLKSVWGSVHHFLDAEQQLERVKV